MAWTKHFQKVNYNPAYYGQGQQNFNDHLMMDHSSAHTSTFASWLPDIYSGQPNRIERYGQYDSMDLDSEVNRALDTIADSCTQENAETGMAIELILDEQADSEDAVILNEMLRQWYELNEWKKRIWGVFRNMIKYGDQLMIRDPESLKLTWVQPSDVDSIIVDEAKGREPDSYLIKNLSINFQTLVATDPLIQNSPNTIGMAPNIQNRFPAYSTPALANPLLGPGSGGNEGAYQVNATHVVHFTLSQGTEASWPFGVSVLENVFKVYKQKELLEESVLIYRVQRAPERRIFKIHTGKLPPHKAAAFLERTKNEIQQKRIPNRAGGTSVVDATYNPMSMLEDYFFAVGEDGKGSSVETLDGGQQLGEIDDLKYFNHKFRIGLRVPRSYMPDFNDGGGAVFNDGRVGTAYFEEYSFSRYCERLQNMFSDPMDLEFKMFCRARGVNIHASLFSIRLVKPQNFSKYRQIELDNALIGSFSNIKDTRFISKRMMLIKYLGWDNDDVLLNEKWFAEENSKGTTGMPEQGGGGGSLNSGGEPPLDLEPEVEPLPGEEGGEEAPAPEEGGAAPEEGGEESGLI
ncbi:MAG: portal protein [Gammaproteobacteria bacterium]|nr:portal protein [Gammaproteobacteria bacterium]